MAGTRKKRGFTLIELLVVIAVIGILVGLILPLVGGMGERALDSQAKDLCTQVADAWKILAMRETRLPSTGLLNADKISSAATRAELGGDFAYQMTPAMGYLLNEWHCTTPIPSADAARFHPKKPNKPPHVLDPRVKFGVCPTEDDLVDYNLVDAVLERDDLQKRFGVFAPWVRRKLNDAAEEEGKRVEDCDERIQALLQPYSKPPEKYDGEHWGYGIVTVALDTDGDGFIRIPAGMLGNAEDIVLRETAVAWVWNERRDKAIHSW